MSWRQLLLYSLYTALLRFELRQIKSQRAQEVEEALLRLRWEADVVADYSVGFGALARMLLDGVDQSSIRWTRAAIVQEEHALAYAPQRRGAEFVAGGSALGNIVGK